VLVLSEFAGAAQSLGAGAILVNPWNITDMAAAIQDALTMSEQVRHCSSGHVAGISHRRSLKIFGYIDLAFSWVMLLRMSTSMRAARKHAQATSMIYGHMCGTECWDVGHTSCAVLREAARLPESFSKCSA